MRNLSTAAALAILLLTAGVAGVVSADPTSTDYRTTSAGVTDVATDARPAATTDARPTTDARVDVATARSDDVADDATFEQRLARRLAHFDLTDAQTREIVTEASRLEEAGASRVVIRSSVVMNLYEFGVEAPFLYANAGGDDDWPDDHRRFHRFIRSLDVTPEEARELHAMAHRMHEAGATNEEIREAIRRTVESDDDEVDDHPGAVDRIVDVLVDRYDLDRQQAAELERLIRGMIDDGADRGEIHAAVDRPLDSYGVDEPSIDERRRRAAITRAL